MMLQLNVPYINQSEKWPTGCESVSTVMMLQSLGIQMDVDTFISYLPKTAFTKENNVLYGGDPRECFVGSPYDPESFGCYAPVIESTLNDIFHCLGISYQAKNVSGMGTAELLKSFLDAGYPVLYWITIDLKPYIEGPAWMVRRPDGSEQLFTWRSNEHCMLLTGYDDDALFFHDPWENHGIIRCPRDLAEKRHHEMYDMAVAILPATFH